MKTKTLSEICQLVKTEYINGECQDEWDKEVHPHLGMCSAIYELMYKRKLSFQDKERFMIEYRKFTKNRKVFYDRVGAKVSGRDEFGWPPKNRPARIKWLDQRILINDK